MYFVFTACTRMQDIVIMVDFSGSLSSYYRTMIQFLRHVVYGLDFRFDRTRLALAAYAEEIRVSFLTTSLMEPLDSTYFRIIK